MRESLLLVSTRRTYIQSSNYKAMTYICQFPIMPIYYFLDSVNIHRMAMDAATVPLWHRTEWSRHFFHIKSSHQVHESLYYDVSVFRHWFQDIGVSRGELLSGSHSNEAPKMWPHTWRRRVRLSTGCRFRERSLPIVLEIIPIGSSPCIWEQIMRFHCCGAKPVKFS
jgi:hypothetical protein